jgi:hypothetical protein
VGGRSQWEKIFKEGVRPISKFFPGIRLKKTEDIHENIQSG